MDQRSSLPTEADVLVVGGGLSGLACAHTLQDSGVDVQLFEASDQVGGRIRTDVVDGFQLDRGFQVLLTAYEEVQKQIDLDALDLQAFRPGSMVWNGSDLVTLGDPFREPSTALQAMRAPIGTLKDKLKVAGLRKKLLSSPASECFGGPDRTTEEELKSLGFSAPFIDKFFRPFLGGVFLERGLDTSARLFRYYFRCFSAGDVSLPAKGMGEIPLQLAAKLEGRVHLNQRATAVAHDVVTLEGGEEIRTNQVVLATESTAAAAFLASQPVESKVNVTAYFSAPEPPTAEPLLILDGVGGGPANHVAVLSAVASSYAPSGQHLISVSGVGEDIGSPEVFREAAKRQLRTWFGAQLDKWEHIRTYVIREALPKHPPGSVPREGVSQTPDGLMVVGDYLRFGSIQGALASGRLAGERILASSH
jgi:phytoene dehydrogenase-like protein